MFGKKEGVERYLVRFVIVAGVSFLMYLLWRAGIPSKVMGGLKKLTDALSVKGGKLWNILHYACSCAKKPARFFKKN